MCVISKLLQTDFQGHRIKSYEQHGYSINYGIKTGFNEAFIIDNETKDALIREDPKSAEIIKPVLRGRDIKRYQAQWAGLWMITTLPSLEIDIEVYPAIKRYLLSFGKDRLEQTGKVLPNGGKSRKKTPHEWFELQDTCAYHELFDKDKLFWIELVENGRFAYDDSGIFGEATTFMMTGKNLKYLCAVLNTKLIRWYLQQVAPTSGMGTLRWKKVYVETIPVAKINEVEQKTLISLADEIITAKDRVDNISTLETKIDYIVCKLYHLTEEEIALINC